MTSSTPRVRPGILDIEPYVPGESKAASGIEPIKLSSNETPLGPSERAVQAYQAAAGQLERYPDGQATLLRTAIAKRFGLNADRIVCGAGSDELLNLLAHAFLGPGDEGIYTEHGFLVYRIAILSRGATPVVVPEKDLHTDVDAILAAVTSRTRIVFLANPNNPTGTYIPIDEVRRLRSNLRGDILLVLDAAYAEYVTRNDYEAGFELVATNDNTVMTRTFSKIYGLAALRIGWCYCPSEIADVLNRIRGPFNLSASSIAAGAAAISDVEFEAKARQHNDRCLGYVCRNLKEMGLRVTPSVANFVLIHFPEDQKLSANAADAYLRSKAILLRKVAGYGLPNALRMTIGSDSDNEAALNALRSFMAGDTA